MKTEKCLKCKKIARIWTGHVHRTWNGKDQTLIAGFCSEKHEENMKTLPVRHRGCFGEWQPEWGARR